MAKPRAIAIHIPVHSWSKDEIVSNAISFGDKVFSCLKSVGLEVWTKRFILPVLPENSLGCRDIEHIVNEIGGSMGDRILVAFPLSPSSQCLKELHNLSNIDSAYFSTSCGDVDCVNRVVEHVYSGHRDVELDFFTRFAISFGMWIETPYFPATANISNVLGFSISLRYVDIASQALLYGRTQLLRDFLEDVGKRLEESARCSGIAFLGIDYSLSPWIEEGESIASLIESLSNSRMGSPGTLSTIHALNTFLRGLIKKIGVRHIGFNEVMLPVAEDPVLNSRVREGLVMVRDLIAYSFACVAGLDMVALPRDADVRRIALDMLTVYRVKNRVVAMRVIPTDLDASSEVKLKNFGVTYVARL